jgi:hypothetical protein
MFVGLLRTSLASENVFAVKKDHPSVWRVSCFPAGESVLMGQHHLSDYRCFDS